MGYWSVMPIKCLLCGRQSIGRKLCRMHYNKMRKAHRLNEFPQLGPHDVFANRYRVIRETGCWEWIGNCNKYGYGIFLLPGEKRVRAHRYAYELWCGPIPEGKIVMHKCDNPPCIAPYHLRLGTKADNNQDTSIKRRHNYGTDHWNGRLTDAQVQAIRKSSETQKALAKNYGVSQPYIGRIKRGHRRLLRS